MLEPGIAYTIPRARLWVVPMVPWHQGPEAIEKRICRIVDFSVAFF